MSQREPDSEPERARESRTASQREPEWARGSQIRLECEPERARKRQSELERLWADVAFYCTLGSLFGRQITKERLDTHLACLNIVLLQNSFKYDSVLSRNVKIRYFLSRNVKIRAMSRKNGINYATSWLRIFYSPAIKYHPIPLKSSVLSMVLHPSKMVFFHQLSFSPSGFKDPLIPKLKTINLFSFLAKCRKNTFPLLGTPR